MSLYVFPSLKLFNISFGLPLAEAICSRQLLKKNQCRVSDSIIWELAYKNVTVLCQNPLGINVDLHF